MSGFTLIELMAVILVIMLLVAISMGVAGYVNQRMAVSTMRSQIAAIEAALEAYKADKGYYPVSSPTRISRTGLAEANNNWALYRALSGSCSNCGRVYLKFSTGQLRENNMLPVVTASSTNLAVNIVDVWGKPLAYYCSPGTAYGLVSPGNYSGTVMGGQKNLTTFDLFSYGADGCTYIPGVSYTNFMGSSNSWKTNWVKPESAIDDIGNW